MAKKRKFNVYRDGKLHIGEHYCATCPYRKESPIYRAGVIAASEESGTAVVCHATLDYPDQAVCFGSYKECKTLPMIMARASPEMVVFTPVPRKKWSKSTNEDS